MNPTEHVYLADPEHREEGGTPAIIESIRAGLAFQLKERVGDERIRALEEGFIDRAMTAWGAEPDIGLLGNPALPRLSIVSFTVRHAGRYLHHNYVVALLNDLFGIQSRGGCSCAGPYGHRLLGIDIETSHAFEREISRGCEGIKPGWVRVNFNYFISEAVFDFIVRAVALVARDGWRLLPWYRFDPPTGMWRHSAGSPEAPLSLHDIRYDTGGLRYPAHRHREPESRLADYLAEAAAILADPSAVLGAAPDAEPLAVGTDFESLRWFWLPDEMGVGAASVAPAALAFEIEGGRVRDGHDGHRPGLDRVRHDEVHVLGDRADHVERDDRDPDRAQLVGRDADVATHDRAGQDQQPRPRQVGDGPDGRRDRLLADERDRVDADPLAAQVVPVRLADRAERHLGDLRAATDDDDPLAEHAVERARQVDRADVGERARRRRPAPRR